MLLSFQMSASFTVNYKWMQNKHRGDPNVEEIPEGSQNHIMPITIPVYQKHHFWVVQIVLHHLLWDMDPAPVRYLHRKITDQQPQ